MTHGETGRSRWLRSAFLKDFGTAALFTVVGKGVGFLVPFAIAAVFGAGHDTDAFFYAYGLTLLFAGIFGSVVEVVVVPYVAEVQAQDSEAVGPYIFTLQLVLAGSVTVLVAAFSIVAKPVLGIVTGLPETSLVLVRNVFVELSPVLVFLTWNSVAAGSLNAIGRFAVPAWSRGIRPGVAILLLVFARQRYGIHILAYGYVAGEIARVILLTLVLRRQGLLKVGLIPKPLASVRAFMGVAGYQILAVMALSFNPVVDRTVATFAGGGSVSLLEYGNKLYYAGSAVFDSALAVVLLSHWSKFYLNSTVEEFATKIKSAVTRVWLGAAVFALILTLLNGPIVKLALARGAFPASELSLVATVYVAYLVGLPFDMAAIVYERAFLVIRQARLLLIVALVKVVLNTGLDFWLLRLFGLPGIALSTTMVVVAQWALLRLSFRSQAFRAAEIAKTESCIATAAAAEIGT